jgi:lipoprotein-releasing system permease protein
MKPVPLGVGMGVGVAVVALGIVILIVRGRHDFTHGHRARGVLEFIGAALGITFAGLTWWTTKLPVLRGSMWSLKDTLIKAGAIVSGVLFMLSLLTAILPWLLDRLEGRTFSSFVGARHVRSQKSGFLTVISVLSICGVALSSCALSSVVSVMGGFSQDLKRKILGNNAHIVIDTESAAPWADYDTVLNTVRLVPGVVAATPVVHGEVMISSPSNLAGVIVRGVDPGSIGTVIELPNDIEVGKFTYLENPDKLRHLPADEVIGIGPGGEQYLKGTELPGFPDDLDPSVREALATAPPRPAIIIGRELAKTLHVYVGDEVTLVSPLGDLGPMGVMPRTKKFRVAAIFFSGMYEYDASHVYTTMQDAESYFVMENKISVIDVKVEDAERADVITPLVEAAIARPDLRVRDWREMNKNLFSALKLERLATFIILSIAIMVASFCIICTLLLMVTEKGKEIAILKAIGASDSAILRTFMTEGMIIGGIGTVFGVATGLGLCAGLSWFGLRLDPDVYYIDRLPISVNGWDFFTVAVSALTICTLATLYPARAASKLRPVDGLRYE